uniref:Uncharacterized protein n=1 Tax=Panagrolaimus sp. PS1159 TaxID=55785 RepID=A0AC35GBE5_9BILA
MIEPDTPGIFTSLNKLKDKPSPRLGSGMKLEHQECVEYWTWKCLTDLQTLNCYMNMRYSEMAEIINSCSNSAYNKLGVSLETFEDVKIPES